ncbi:MAG: MFS transporter [Oscillospiraceae bacterium]
MATLFLSLIYLAFISLGLPDSMLGASWPAMREALSLPISGAGPIAMIITCGTVISSLASGKMLKRFGTGRVMIVSVSLTAAALLGIALAPSYIWLCFLAVPLGIGGGAVDAGLNNFVALHYKASHMSWLHCFWGFGATAGPIIMGGALSLTGKWQNGYLTVGIIQIAVVALLFLSLPLWKKYEPVPPGAEKADHEKKLSPFKLPGAASAVSSFFFYCALETATGLWAASYLVENKGLSSVTAAKWASVFYLGITVGRLVSGFVAMKISGKSLIFIGQSICLCGAVLIALPLGNIFSAIGLAVVGLGCAPIYPSMIHETPRRFGAENSGALIGFQMACAYMGNLIVPPLIGVLGTVTGLWVFPYVLIFCCGAMFVLAQITEKSIARAKNK